MHNVLGAFMANVKTLLIEKKSARKDINGWETLEKLMFNGPKANCVEETDLLQ